MTREETQKLVISQRDYFDSGETLDVLKRRQNLRLLYDKISQKSEDIAAALYKDLGKSESESYMCEIGTTLSEIGFLIKNIKKLAKIKRVKTPITHFPATSYILPAPYGVTLVLSPWNYPFLLSIVPLAEAIAAGNTVVLKPSNYSQNTSLVIKNILEEIFPSTLCTVVLGGREENANLLSIKFDYIFFTGGKTVGSLVYESAAKHLTPVTLELGGKSPCIVDKSANIPIAAKRIVFGKFLNAGQTCVAPDYILVHKSVKEEFLSCVKREIISQYGDNPLQDNGYGKIITERHFDRINGLIAQDKVVFGGKSDKNLLKIQPTVLDNVSFNDAVMQEEIFGPIMPIIYFSDIDKVIKDINNSPSPLALYIFAEDIKIQDKVIHNCRFGGGAVNDVIMHLASPYLPFGGFGDSGIGSYHGEKGYQTFSHYKSILKSKTFMDLPFRYKPYTDKKARLIKKLLK